MSSTPSSTGGGGSSTKAAPQSQSMQARTTVEPFESYQHTPASTGSLPTLVVHPPDAIPVAQSVGVTRQGVPPGTCPSSATRAGHPGASGVSSQQNPNGGPLPRQPHQPAREWTSPCLDWLHDGETCWWSLWCPLLLFSRTTARFDLVSSPLSFSCMVLGAAAVTAIFSAALGPFVSILSVLGFALWRAHYRGKIRAAYGIVGGWLEDLSLHVFCSPCAVAQEAREANAHGRPAKEFCTGEDLVPLTSDPTATGDLSFLASLRQVSRCSSLLLFASLLLFLLVLFHSSPGSGLVLTLAILQPLIVLYLVYWRRHRRAASLDTVVKLFAVGFFFTSQVAGMTEPVIEILLMAVAGAAGVLPTLDPETATEEDVQAWVHKNMGLVLLMCFSLAFFVAALVEELYKYLILRYCTLGGPMRNPQTILIYLISGALGFACAENIMYAFSGGTSLGPSPLGGSSSNKLSMFVDEISVLTLRALMPVHVICAALQAIQWVKSVAEDIPMSTFGLLFPAIFLHGSFDFILMAAGALVFGEHWDEEKGAAASLVIALGITVVSLLVTYRMWCAQQERLSADWLPVRDTESTERATGQETGGGEGGGGEWVSARVGDRLVQQQDRRSGAAVNPSSPATMLASSQIPSSYHRNRRDEGLLSSAQALEQGGGPEIV